MVLMKAGGFKKSEGRQEGPKGSNIFYNLRISAEAGSKHKVITLPNGKEADGYYEDGWFLCKLADAPIVSVHRDRNSSNTALPLVLCPKTFGNEYECPLCETYQKSNNRQALAYKAVEHHITLPFLATNKQTNPQIQRGKFEIIPIYWFSMNITNYIEDYFANFERLEAANNAVDKKTGKKRYGIHRVPYRIFAKHRGEKQKQEYYFIPLKESDSHEITVEHPFVDEWLGDDGKWLWDNDYAELLSNLVVARYRPIINDDGEMHDYDGHYERALEYVGEIANEYPNPRTELENPINNDDEEEEDIEY